MSRGTTGRFSLPHRQQGEAAGRVLGRRQAVVERSRLYGRSRGELFVTFSLEISEPHLVVLAVQTGFRKRPKRSRTRTFRFPRRFPRFDSRLSFVTYRIKHLVKEQERQPRPSRSLQPSTTTFGTLDPSDSISAFATSGSGTRSLATQGSHEEFCSGLVRPEEFQSTFEIRLRITFLDGFFAQTDFVRYGSWSISSRFISTSKSSNRRSGVAERVFIIIVEGEESSNGKDLDWNGQSLPARRSWTCRLGGDYEESCTATGYRRSSRSFLPSESISFRLLFRSLRLFSSNFIADESN